MSSTPADINKDISGTCDLKCRLILEYEHSRIPDKGITIQRKNNSSFGGIDSTKLKFPFQGAKITYNTIQHHMTSIHIFKPSLHTYAGNRIDAELILVYGDVGPTADDDEPVHLLCIPIVQSTSHGILDELLEELDETGNSNLNLNNVVPKKPFYAYKGSIGSYNNLNIVVFRRMDELTITEKWLNTLNKHDMSESFKLNNNEKISYNKNGPENKNTDQIFPITCEPIDGVEYQEEPDDKLKSPFIMSEADLNEWGNKAIVQIIVGILIILFLYSIFGFIFKRTNKIASSVSDPVGSTEFK